jgi:arabinofuranan 3-O-arabinosyltransferase
VLVIPESINPGWVARTAAGERLTPVAVNGWQQGWLVPAGNAGTITLTFASNSQYRTGLAVGLALLPLLAALALWRRRREAADPDDAAPAQPWASGAWAAVAVLAAGAVIAGAVGVLVVGAALGLRYAARRRQRWRDDATVVLSAGGLIMAGAVLSRHPWRSVDGYAGHSANVQLLALISLAVLAASVVTVSDRAGNSDDD